MIEGHRPYWTAQEYQTALRNLSALPPTATLTRAEIEDLKRDRDEFQVTGGQPPLLLPPGDSGGPAGMPNLFGIAPPSMTSRRSLDSAAPKYTIQLRQGAQQQQAASTIDANSYAHKLLRPHRMVNYPTAGLPNLDVLFYLPRIEELPNSVVARHTPTFPKLTDPPKLSADMPMRQLVPHQLVKVFAEYLPEEQFAEVAITPQQFREFFNPMPADVPIPTKVKLPYRMFPYDENEPHLPLPDYRSIWTLPPFRAISPVTETNPLEPHALVEDIINCGRRVFIRASDEGAEHAAGPNAVFISLARAFPALMAREESARLSEFFERHTDMTDTDKAHAYQGMVRTRLEDWLSWQPQQPMDHSPTGANIKSFVHASGLPLGVAFVANDNHPHRLARASTSYSIVLPDDTVLSWTANNYYDAFQERPEQPQQFPEQLASNYDMYDYMIEHSSPSSYMWFDDSPVLVERPAVPESQQFIEAQAQRMRELQSLFIFGLRHVQPPLKDTVIQAFEQRANNFRNVDFVVTLLRCKYIPWITYAEQTHQYGALAWMDSEEIPATWFPFTHRPLAAPTSPLMRTQHPQVFTRDAMDFAAQQPDGKYLQEAVQQVDAYEQDLTDRLFKPNEQGIPSLQVPPFSCRTYDAHQIMRDRDATRKALLRQYKPDSVALQYDYLADTAAFWDNPALAQQLPFNVAVLYECTLLQEPTLPQLYTFA